MAEPHTHLFVPLGSLFVLAALVVSGALGLLGKPAVPSIAISKAIFTTGYVLVRLPQILGLFHADGPKAF